MFKRLEWLVLSSFLLLTFVSCSRGGGYVRKVVLQAPWGSSPGQFGLLQEAEGVAPEALAVDHNKNMWILDLVNSRVQEFNFDGEFMRALPIPLRAMDLAVNAHNQLILLAPYDEQLVIMTETGHVVRQLSIPQNIDLIEDIRLTKFGLVLVTSEQKSVLLLSTEELAHPKQAPSLMKKNPMPVQGVASRFSERRFFTRWIDQNTGVIRIFNAAGEEINHISIHSERELGAIQFLNEDGKKNFYILEELLPASGKSLFKITRFTSTGKRIASIEIPNQNVVDVHKPVYVDEDGSIYFLNVQPQKFEVIKWEWD